MRSSSPAPRKRRLVALLLFAGAVAAGSGAAVAFAGTAGGVSTAAIPSVERLGRVPVLSIPDRVIPRGRAVAAARLATGHGGIYTAAMGDQVKVYVSDAYPVDDRVNQRWADFIARLVHGREIAKLTVYVAPFAEVQTLCRSTEAEACYVLAQQQMIVPGDTPPDGVPVEEIVAHEYGHHVALNRSNWPWQAAAWGTKRWASYEHVCERVLAHTAFPGDEGANYYRNPGEAFAESYRVLNDQRFAVSSVQLPWSMDGFNPDPTALSLIEQDVLKPWTGSSVSRWRGHLTQRGIRRLTLATPRDGLARFVLHAPRGSAIGVFDPRSGKMIGAARAEIRYGICGERQLGLAVGLTRPGTFSVAVFQP
jgi:hypothetical protein